MLPGQACSRALVLTFPSMWSHGEKRHTGLSSSCPAMAMVRVQHWGSLGQGAALGGVSGSESSIGGGLRVREQCCMNRRACVAALLSHLHFAEVTPINVAAA